MGGANKYDGEVARDPFHTASGDGIMAGVTGGNVDMIKPVEAYQKYALEVKA